MLLRVALHGAAGDDLDRLRDGLELLGPELLPWLCAGGQQDPHEVGEGGRKTKTELRRGDLPKSWPDSAPRTHGAPMLAKVASRIRP